jgi:hypothetical protein
LVAADESIVTGDVLLFANDGMTGIEAGQHIEDDRYAPVIL